MTHDRYFLNRVATTILSFEGDGRVVRYAGNYDDYVLQRAAVEAARAAARRAGRRERTRPAAAMSAPGARGERGRRGKSLTMAEERELVPRCPARSTPPERRWPRRRRVAERPALYATRGGAVAAPPVARRAERRRRSTR